MSGIKEKLKTFVNVFLSHPICVSNGIFLAVTTGFEQAWENVVFKCPNKTSSAPLYSIVMVVAPAVALLILGILASNMAWRLCQGLQSRKKSSDCDWFRPGCRHLIVVILRALVIPLTWVFVALMDGDFYVCYCYRPECPPGSSSDFINGVPCTKNITVWDDDNRMTSQMIGWIFWGVCLISTLIVVFCSRCYGKKTYFPHLYSNQLKKTERNLIEKLLQERAVKDAKTNVDELMVISSILPAEHWESICKEDSLKNSPLREWLSDNSKVLRELKEKVAPNPDTEAPNPETEAPNQTQAPNPET